jgi:hypothetical protein
MRINDVNRVIEFKFRPKYQQEHFIVPIFLK